jgi:hypothetical protein
MFDMASTILGDEITLDGLDNDSREPFLEGVTAPANPNDGTWTNFFRSRSRADSSCEKEIF